VNHVLVFGEAHLRRILARYFSYYHRARTHLALEKDAPDGRPVELPEAGRIMQIPQGRWPASSLCPPGRVVAAPHRRVFTTTPLLSVLLAAV
jgi:hypothetical protein